MKEELKQYGITDARAGELLKKYGYNELPAARPKHVGQIAAEVIKEPMFILLIGCSILYMLLGDYNEGIIIFCSVFVIIFITFYQHRKTEKSLEALRQLSSPRALVIRNGKEKRIAGRDVVPGDVIKLHEGDRVPADATLLHSNNLSIDESLLTGEFIPVIKSHENSSVKTIYSGTLVVAGSGTAQVSHTGIKTQFGKIGTSLESIEKSPTQLQQEMKKLIKQLFIASIGISLVVIAVYDFTRGNFLESVLNGLASAMALLPEEFPVVLTIFLALGAWRLSKNSILTRNPSAIETLGSATVLCCDKTGTITQNKMEVAALYTNQKVYANVHLAKSNFDVHELITCLYHASPLQTIDPMEKAIKNWGESIITEKVDIIKEYPLSKELLAMSRIVSSDGKNNLHAYAKGAPEAIFNMCRLSETDTHAHMKVVHEFAAIGYRVIAGAQCSMQAGSVPNRQTEIPFVFTGLVGFADPVRPEVPQAIRECYDAGIKVIMITGDYPATAKTIAGEIGISNHEKIITGSELRQMSTEELAKRIRDTHVFARIVPEQKLQLIRALKANGEVVAMTGDGVNDAPALKAADIGVAMGMKGTDVAREASTLVLLDDNFASIVHAIRTGRRIYDNLQKAMSYIMAIHIPIIGLVLLPAFFPTLPVLLMPLHIVFMELIIDPVCSVAFESEQEEKTVMSRPPRKAEERFFGWNKIAFSLFQGLLLLTIVLGVYFLSIDEGHSSGEVRAIAFSSLITGNIFLILTTLSKTRSFYSVLTERNISLIIITTLAMIMLLCTITVPVLQKLFSFQFPGFGHFSIAFLGAAIMLFVLEVIKKIKMSQVRKKIKKAWTENTEGQLNLS
ncbi:MAG: cation-translocating P-type ATPase [Bacteroidota bacterium]